MYVAQIWRQKLQWYPSRWHGHVLFSRICHLNDQNRSIFNNFRAIFISLLYVTWRDVAQIPSNLAPKIDPIMTSPVVYTVHCYAWAPFWAWRHLSLYVATSCNMEDLADHKFRAILSMENDLIQCSSGIFCPTKCEIVDCWELPLCVPQLSCFNMSEPTFWCCHGDWSKHWNSEKDK